MIGVNGFSSCNYLQWRPHKGGELLPKSYLTSGGTEKEIQDPEENRLDKNVLN